MEPHSKLSLQGWTALAAGLCFLLQSACGDGEIRVKPAKVRKGSVYSYEYTENGCSTGRQTFGTLDDYCRGLLDDDLNHGCAASQRRDAWTKNCNDY